MLKVKVGTEVLLPFSDWLLLLLLILATEGGSQIVVVDTLTAKILSVRAVVVVAVLVTARLTAKKRQTPPLPLSVTTKA